VSGFNESCRTGAGFSLGASVGCGPVVDSYVEVGGAGEVTVPVVEAAQSTQGAAGST
jgi:hypothetical protein